jgi:zinc/manganese transport system ATP-binding protein
MAVNADASPLPRYLPPTLSLQQASFGWHGRPAVRDLTGAFEPRSMTAVIGPNGAGKSTLVKGLMGMLRPLSGALRIEGGTRAQLALLPQAGELERAFPLTVYELVAMGAWRRVGAWRGFGAAEHERIEQALAAVGMEGAGRRIIGTLSGGQLQRALFARMLLQDAAVLLLDEPFSAVDSHTTQALMAILSACHARGCTIIAVLHDMDLVRASFPRALLLSGRAVAWGATRAVLTEDNLRAARTLRDRELAWS